MTLRLYTFTVISLFSIIVGHILRRSSATGIDQLETDGELFVKRLVHGEKMSTMPGYLLFTAPFKVCKEDCEDREGNEMAFPIYLGKKAQEKFKELYKRDYHKLQLLNNAPFNTRPTKKLLTLCINKATEKQTTATPTPLVGEIESTDMETSTMSTQRIMFLNLMQASKSSKHLEIAPTIVSTTKIKTGSETQKAIEDYKDTTEEVEAEDSEETYIMDSQTGSDAQLGLVKRKKVTPKVVFLKTTKVQSQNKNLDLRNVALGTDYPDWMKDFFYY